MLAAYPTHQTVAELLTAPPSVAGSLEKLQLHGNQLRELPQSIGSLTSLKSLSLQGNALRCLPQGVTCLQVRLRRCGMLL